MSISKQSLYKATNVGGLLVEDSVRVFEFLHRNRLDFYTDALIEQVLPVKSITSRRRIFQELKRRYNVLDTALVEYFLQTNRAEQTVIAFYAALKNYRFLNGVVFEILIPKYKLNQESVSTMDILTLLDSKAAEQEHIANWSVRTRKNMCIFILSMLKEVGIQQNGLIVPLSASAQLWQLIAAAGDLWMLQAALLSKNEQQQVL